MTTLNHHNYSLAKGILLKKLFPVYGGRYYEHLVRSYLLHRYAGIACRYEASECPAGYLSGGAPVWVFLSGKDAAVSASLLQSVREESGNRMVHMLDRRNCLNYVPLPESVADRLPHVPDGVLSALLGHALLFGSDGTYVDASGRQSAKKGHPLHGFVSDMLCACISDRLPVVDPDLPDILVRMARELIPSVGKEARDLDRMIAQAFPLRKPGTNMN